MAEGVSARDVECDTLEAFRALEKSPYPKPRTRDRSSPEIHSGMSAFRGSRTFMQILPSHGLQLFLLAWPQSWMQHGLTGNGTL
eukprot:8768227-Pyramimonas_sp.AAC.1